MREFIIEVMTNWGYFGTFLLIAVENVFPPIPSEVILTFAGFLTTVTTLNVPLMIAFATLGSITGAFILYFAGRLLSPERVSSIVNGKIGRLLRFDASDIEKARASFAKSGYISVPICHCVPILRSLISIPAGMSKMPVILFTALTVLGSLVWNTVLISLGAFAGGNWQNITKAFSSASGAAKLLITAAVILGIILLWRKKSKAKHV